MLLLIGQPRVLIARDLIGILREVGRGAPDGATTYDDTRVGEPLRSLCHQRVRGLEGQVREELLSVEEALLVGIPGTRDVPGREPASRAATSEHVGALVAGRPREGIASLVGVGSSEEVS